MEQTPNSPPELDAEGLDRTEPATEIRDGVEFRITRVPAEDPNEVIKRDKADKGRVKYFGSVAARGSRSTGKHS